MRRFILPGACAALVAVLAAGCGGGGGGSSAAVSTPAGSASVGVTVPTLPGGTGTTSSGGAVSTSQSCGELRNEVRTIQATLQRQVQSIGSVRSIGALTRRAKILAATLKQDARQLAATPVPQGPLHQDRITIARAENRIATQLEAIQSDAKQGNLTQALSIAGRLTSSADEIRTAAMDIQQRCSSS